jgi:PIN domain nuclease of toxin-antitoxin system
LGWQAAARAYSLDGLEHRDPGDRLLIATAIDLRCPMVTYDRKILEFAAAHGSRNQFSVMPE